MIINRSAVKETIETRAKLAYQDFYNEYKHAFCLGSWNSLTKSQKEHYRRVSEKAMWEEFINITNDTKLVCSSYDSIEHIELESIEEYERANPNLLLF